MSSDVVMDTMFGGLTIEMRPCYASVKYPVEYPTDMPAEWETLMLFLERFGYNTAGMALMDQPCGPEGAYMSVYLLVFGLQTNIRTAIMDDMKPTTELRTA